MADGEEEADAKARRVAARLALRDGSAHHMHHGMSFFHKTLALAAGLNCVACGALTGTADESSNSTISLRIDPGPELNGRNLSFAAGDSLVVRATVIGNPDAYSAPVVSAVDPSLVEARADGSVRLLRPGATTFAATAAARSTRTTPRLLSATGSLSIVCTMEARAGINLTIVDSLSGVAVAGPGAMRLAVTDGAFADSLRTVTMFGLWGAAYERAGTYTATVDADGYLPWRRDGLIVPRGLCHVIPISVTARLVRR